MTYRGQRTGRNLEALGGLSATDPLYCTVGSDNTAPDGTETALGAEGSRAITSAYGVTGGVASIKAFFNTAQGNGNMGGHILPLRTDYLAYLSANGMELGTQSERAVAP